MDKSFYSRDGFFSLLSSKRNTETLNTVYILLVLKSSALTYELSHNVHSYIVFVCCVLFILHDKQNILKDSYAFCLEV